MTKITMRSGAEGPRHDPYHFEEITVDRQDGRKVTLHVGLGVWATAEGGPMRERTDSPQEAYHMFERYAGVSHHAMERAMHALPIRRIRQHPCGVKYLRDVNGYPGETLTVCEKCGDVIDGHQDMSVIT